MAYAFRARVALDFRHADRAHHLVVADQFRRRGSAKIFQISSTGSAAYGSGRGIDRLDFLVMLARARGRIYFLYKPSGQIGHVKLSEMRKEVATLEHEITESD